MAFLCTWLGFVNSNCTVTPMNFLLWLIEASHIPGTILCAILIPFDGFTGNLLTFQQSLHINAPLTKTALFIVIRYSESQPDFMLNTFQIFVFNRFCDAISK